ncbi:MAG TPA: acetyl/propionyl/methylcrotonyl-CoA carboxylase subunit alpha [Phenylobacterium sp.]|uniref:acetyl/propionyl/methylcrotonyl-CoA carboxylase subunit alpha n=1 Tax=Phenylobacterium sp. TaxID=1871053 RepID=UPI002B48AFD2|nr:acetyl/propionyl/methylcrotonyl-CoA carboxylase subunit alpha [Phenylobacterium sp.]HKR87064.1 acetyl/propionyl/methylcrotonyl-CoA carboxylase subunit alpha [Phenylobacterium sp.]
MLESLLIANRGEIARRIIRTCRRLGIRTVAVYSEADASAPFVREADEAVAIGPAPAAESYLVGAKILDAARRTGAQAIHPGYGFLSENAEFAEAVTAAGLIWVGPPPSAIRAMGLKDAAKALMAKAGVPVTPGYLGEDQSDARLAAEAAKIGFPLLIKAVAGGGGKGMRRVDAGADFEAALVSCRREAKASFGDDRVLLETYATRPRHIEVQVFADAHGNVVHLFERDCSLQRRHQKVVEEAPAPGMSDAVREAVCQAAVLAAKSVGYVGAGTIEFIADTSQGLQADRIWFMEMNTRLQVEHPVTEAITGQDLVEWQLRVASGEPLPLAQAEIPRRGHAIEARLYAENPHTGFLPSIGRLEHFRTPSDIRVDSAVEEGGVVTPFYDPMIAKLIAYGPTRQAAAARLAAACRAVEVWPVKTNAGFLARCLGDPDFLAGAVDTGFIGERIASLVPPAEPSDTVLQAAVGEMVKRAGIQPALTGFRLNADPSFRVQLDHEGSRHTVQFTPEAGPPGLSVFVCGRDFVVFEDGEPYALTLPRAEAGPEGEGGDGVVESSMPGLIIDVMVAAGEVVKKGQALVVLEAMKMEHTLTAPFDGKVASLSVKKGDRVAEHVALVKLEASEVK